MNMDIPSLSWWITLGGGTLTDATHTKWLSLLTSFLCLSGGIGYFLSVRGIAKGSGRDTSSAEVAIRELRLLFIFCGMTYILRSLLSFVPIWSAYLICLICLNSIIIKFLVLQSRAVRMLRDDHDILNETSEKLKMAINQRDEPTRIENLNHVLEKLDRYVQSSK